MCSNLYSDRPSQKVAVKGSRKGYEPVYTLLSNPHPDWRGGVLKRSYPGKWSLGVAAKVGAPRTHGRSAERPTLDQIDAGFAKIKDDTSLVSGGAMAAVGAAAGLERIGSQQLTLAEAEAHRANCMQVALQASWLISLRGIRASDKRSLCAMAQASCKKRRVQLGLMYDEIARKEIFVTRYFARESGAGAWRSCGRPGRKS